MERPRPPVVSPSAQIGGPPSDAFVLFDGSDLSEWAGHDTGTAPWRVETGYFEVVPRSGAIRTRRAFGDCQLHLEFATPPAEGVGQGRANSGVYFMGRYELQVLDSFENDTYPDGQAGAIYAQQPPLVNASRPPGEWQSYDVVFRRPRFSDAGALVSPARFTVLHNGVLIQEAVEPTGPVAWQGRPPYSSHPDALPLELQDHGNPVRFRNVWIRELEEPAQQPRPVPLGEGRTPSDDAAVLAGYAGRYGGLTVEARDGGLWLLRGDSPVTLLEGMGERAFGGRSVDVTLVFDADDPPGGVEFTIGLSTRRYERERQSSARTQ